MRACVCDNGIIAIWALGYMRSGNTSKKLLHIFAGIIVCLANSFCCVVACWRAILNCHCFV
uniref:Uncharacterized protein n=1 Tax=Triticum urartu TaxID=4572 RepID=A0A8R7R4F6_TRIUA